MQLIRCSLFIRQENCGCLLPPTRAILQQYPATAVSQSALWAQPHCPAAVNIISKLFDAKCIDCED
jgi:hypothetical protein